MNAPEPDDLTEFLQLETLYPAPEDPERRAATIRMTVEASPVLDLQDVLRACVLTLNPVNLAAITNEVLEHHMLKCEDPEHTPAWVEERTSTVGEFALVLNRWIATDINDALRISNTPAQVYGRIQGGAQERVTQFCRLSPDQQRAALAAGNNTPKEQS